jgi:hypothetical protein
MRELASLLVRWRATLEPGHSEVPVAMEELFTDEERDRLRALGYVN